MNLRKSWQKKNPNIMKNCILLLTTLFIFPLVSKTQVFQADKIIVSVSKDWKSNEGRVYLFEKTGTGWGKAVFSAEVHYGSEGMAWGTGLHPNETNFDTKKEGDRRSPAGIFSIGTLYGLDPAPPRGVRYPYTQISEQTRCIDDAASPLYNRIVEEDSAKKQWKSAEHMVRVRPDYKYVLVINHNASNETGNGSCIFLHVNNIPTTGCTSMDESTMVELLRWLDPSKKAVLVQLPYPEYLRLRTAWGLPAIPESMP
jgi:L,D-peptidoglycan transpeptidase YkuD (ErfK/YbiS/YcfS/YnhG family)